MESYSSSATNTNNDCFAISTTEQTKGRGTSGRSWIGHKGNAFVTIAIPVERVTSSLNIPITLFPIQMGIIVCKRIRRVFENLRIDSNIVKVKWPNDGKNCYLKNHSTRVHTYQEIYNLCYQASNILMSK